MECFDVIIIFRFGSRDKFHHVYTRSDNGLDYQIHPNSDTEITSQSSQIEVFSFIWLQVNKKC